MNMTPYTAAVAHEQTSFVEVLHRADELSGIAHVVEWWDTSDGIVPVETITGPHGAHVVTFWPRITLFTV
jgi:hypothetical protein